MQIEWTHKFTKGAEYYLRHRGFDIKETHIEDDVEPYIIAFDYDDDALVFILLQAWTEELPDEVNPAYRTWCECKLGECLSGKDAKLPKLQRVRFDILDMLVSGERGLIRHHENAFARGL